MTLRAICLAGPTAAGKTAAALAFAAEWPVEIVSVDSALVYRGMDIGTAKPSAAERAAVPHHLIDILDPTEAYSAARFVADASRLIAEITRARPAAAAGGRNDAVLQGAARRPGRDARGRRRACAPRSTRAPPAQGWPALHAELRARRPGHRGAAGARRRAAHPAGAGGLAGQRPAARRPGTAARGRRRRRRCRWCRWSLTSRAWLHARIAAAFRRHAGRRLRRRSACPARPRRPAPGPAGDALRRLPPGLGGAGLQATWRRCANPASPPPASSPSASSPGCARCRRGTSSPATRPAQRRWPCRRCTSCWLIAEHARETRGGRSRSSRRRSPGRRSAWSGWARRRRSASPAPRPTPGRGTSPTASTRCRPP